MPPYQRRLARTVATTPPTISIARLKWSNVPRRPAWCRILTSHQFTRMRGTIGKGRSACRNSGHEPRDHFNRAIKPSIGGNGAVQNAADYHLSRYACYLVALNGDPRKPEIAAAQTYFTEQTRRAEIHLPPTTPQPPPTVEPTSTDPIIRMRLEQLEQNRKIEAHDREIQTLREEVEQVRSSH